MKNQKRILPIQSAFRQNDYNISCPSRQSPCAPTQALQHAERVFGQEYTTHYTSGIPAKSLQGRLMRVLAKDLNVLTIGHAQVLTMAEQQQ